MLHAAKSYMFRFQRMVVLLGACVLAVNLASAAVASAASAPTWSAPTSTLSMSPIVTGIGCTSTVCLASSNSKLAIASVGQKFSALGSNFKGFANAVWCDRTSSTCVVVGDGYTQVSLNNGSSWNTAPPSQANFTTSATLTCTPSVGCVALQSATTYFAPWKNGSLGAWVSAAKVPKNGVGVACNELGTCLDLQSNGQLYRSSNGGSTWALETSPTLTALQQGLSTNGATLRGSLTCVTRTSACILVADSQTNGTITLNSTDGGASWSVADAWNKDATSTLEYSSVACIDTAHCVASALLLDKSQMSVTNDNLISNDFGKTWTANGDNLATAFTCPTSSACFGYVNLNSVFTELLFSSSTDVTPLFRFSTSADLASWTSVNDATDFESSAVSCSSTTSCAVLGYSPSGVSLNLTTDGGATWHESVPALPGLLSGNVLPTVACSSAACVVTGEDVHGPVLAVTTDQGATWSKVAGPSSGMFTNVTCVSSHCVAVGGEDSQASASVGDMFIYNSNDGGLTWTSALDAAPTSGVLQDVTCSSVVHCVAVGSTDGDLAVVASTLNGTNWIVKTTTQHADLGYVACSTTNICLATTGPAATTSASVTTIKNGVAGKFTKWSSSIQWSGCAGSQCWVYGASSEKVSTNFGVSFSAAVPTALQKLQASAQSSLTMLTPVEVFAPSCVSTLFCVQSTSDGHISYFR